MSAEAAKNMTPGKWRARDDGEAIAIVDEEDKIVAYVVKSSRSPKSKIGKRPAANAEMIAQVPEMIAILREVGNVLCDVVRMGDQVENSPRLIKDIVGA